MVGANLRHCCINFLRPAVAAAKQAAGVDMEHALFLQMVGFSFEAMADMIGTERPQDQARRRTILQADKKILSAKICY